MIKRMKILHIIPSLSGLYGGPALAVRQLCQELHNQGVETAIATTCVSKDVACEKAVTPVYFFSRQFSWLLPADFSLSLGLKIWLSQHIKDFDLLHIHSLFTYPSSVACFYARKYRIPYILRPAGMLNDFCLTKSAFKKKIYISFFERENLQKAAAVHFTSEEEMCQANKFGLNNQKIVLPVGLNLDKLAGINALKGVLRNQYPQIGGRKIILFLSRLDPKKGLDVLIPALRILRDERDDFVFVLAGSGNKGYEESIRRKLVEAGLLQLSIITGFVGGDFKLSLLADADIFVLPSYDENFGVAVVEAMAAGLPVVVSNRVNICGLIESAGAGIITGLDGQEIASALSRLFLDQGLRVEMGSRGRKLAQDNFDVRDIAKKMREIYSRLVLINNGRVENRCAG